MSGLDLEATAANGESNTDSPRTKRMFPPIKIESLKSKSKSKYVSGHRGFISNQKDSI